MMFTIKSQQDNFNDDLAAKEKEISALRDEVMEVENSLDDIRNREDEAAERKKLRYISWPINTPDVTANGSCANAAHKLLPNKHPANKHC